MIDAPHILVVDDDRRIRELLKSYLMEQGYRVSMAASADEARAKMRGLDFDLLVLDVMMPGETGISLVTSLRQQRQGVPILMLSALSDPPDRIAGLASGSDDYLSKPFEPEELLLRLKGLLKRVAPLAGALSNAMFGNCLFNIARGELVKDGLAIRLTSREKDILRLLTQRPGNVLSRLELAQAGNEDSARSVDVQINRLRQKIEPDPANPKYLQTIRGAGYALFLDEA